MTKNFFSLSYVAVLDPGSGMGKNQDPGSGINIPDPPHWFLIIAVPGQAWKFRIQRAVPKCPSPLPFIPEVSAPT